MNSFNEYSDDDFQNKNIDISNKPATSVKQEGNAQGENNNEFKVSAQISIKNDDKNSNYTEEISNSVFNKINSNLR